MKSRRAAGARKCPSEHAEQCALIARVDWLLPHLRDVVYAIPNQGKRTLRRGAAMRAEGMRKGAVDLVCDVPVAPFHGLRLELKPLKGGKLNDPDQLRVHEALRAQGYRVEMVRGHELAWSVLCDYLGML